MFDLYNWTLKMTLNFTLFAKWTLKKPWILLKWTLKNVKKDLENLEKTLKNTLKNAGNPDPDLFASHFEAFNTLKTRSHGVLMGLSAKLRQILEQPRMVDWDPSGRPIATKIYRDTTEITSNRSQSFLDNLGHFWRLWHFLWHWAWQVLHLWRTCDTCQRPRK